MNVLYLAQLFELGNEPGSDRNYTFCKHLVENGHEVTVVTGNVEYKKAEVKYPTGKWKVFKHFEGIDVWYVYCYAKFRGSFAKRFLYYLTYLFSTLIAGIRVKRPDVIYAISTPLTVGFLGYCVSKLRRVPFVFEVTDVWPDAAVESGVVKNRFLIGAAKKLEMFCYSKAAHIVVLTDGIRRNILNKGVSEDKVTLITNGVNLELFTNENESTKELEEFKGKFVCMYLGAHGAYNSLWTIIEAAQYLKNDNRFQFVFVGDGDEKPKLQTFVKEQELKYVKFMSSIPRSQAIEVLASASAFMLPNRKGKFFEGNLPNKLFDFLATGRPIVVAGHGESANLVLKAGAGRIVEAEDGKAMADALLELANLSQDELHKIGKSARNYVFNNYNRDTLSRKFIQVLCDQVSGQKGKITQCRGTESHD